MEFRTKVELPKGEAEICHQDKLMLFGSCFAENIGRRLVENKFQCDVNPYGILYNPYSIIEALTEIMEGKVYTEDDLFEADGQWHSWMHHGSFSAPTVEECLANINGRIRRAHEWLKQADWLLITWGTAYYYKLKETGKVVSNCHKQPDRLFDRHLARVDYLDNDFGFLLDQLGEFNPNLKVLFTVSPVRHIKDGLRANHQSKGVLLLAIEDMLDRDWLTPETEEEKKKRKEDYDRTMKQMCEKYGITEGMNWLGEEEGDDATDDLDDYDYENSIYHRIHYFPSYEIMMDELRDYRFYADDMLHPSTLAVDYIWGCFAECYFPSETTQVMKDWKEIRKGLEHRPFDASSEGYRRFLTEIVLKIERLKEKLPYLDVQNELELCHTRLNK